MERLRLCIATSYGNRDCAKRGAFYARSQRQRDTVNTCASRSPLKMGKAWNVVCLESRRWIWAPKSSPDLCTWRGRSGHTGISVESLRSTARCRQSQVLLTPLAFIVAKTQGGLLLQYFPPWVIAEFASIRASRILRMAVVRSGPGGTLSTITLTARARVSRTALPCAACASSHPW